MPNTIFYIALFGGLATLIVLAFTNTKPLAWLQRVCRKIFIKIGGNAYEVEQQLIRKSNLKKNGLTARYYRWAHTTLVNQGFLAKGITVTGFTFYSLFWAGVATSVISFIYQLGVFLAFLTFVLVLVVLFIVNTLRSASYLERREAVIMDTLDLLVPQLGNGVKNAITLLLPVINPLIREEFATFLSNLRSKVPFDEAMNMLQLSLGNSFESFAQKAILLERYYEEGMLEIFSDVIEDNKDKRILRRENNEIFNELRFQLIVSLMIIGVFTAWFTRQDTFMQEFFFQSSLGKFMVIVNVALIIFAFGYLTMIKSKEFD